MELEELRELKGDVERRERAQALIIDNQAKRLDELDTLYKVGRRHHSTYSSLPQRYRNVKIPPSELHHLQLLLSSKCRLCRTLPDTA